MGFSGRLSWSLSKYLLKNKLRGIKRFPLVLMLEPLFRCNLECAGCGRIREYSDILDQTMSLEDCLAAVDEAGAPVVSITGGEPLLLPEIEQIVAGIIAIFVLAIFVGYYVVWSVTPALHTPLMSVTNAISSVIIVGALLAVGVEAASSAAAGASWTAKLLGFAALVLASVNIFGGFLVTQRMLAMYKKKS